MHIDDRTRLGLAALAAIEPYVEVGEWVPLGRKRPVVAPGAEDAFSTLHALIAKDRHAGWLADPDDGYGNWSSTRLASPPDGKFSSSAVTVRAGSEPLGDVPSEGDDAIIVRHEGVAEQVQRALRDPSSALAEFRDLVRVVPCTHATLTPWRFSADWQAVSDAVGEDSPIGWAYWFADDSGWDLSRVPDGVLDSERLSNGTLLVHRAAPMQLDTETALAVTKALVAASPAERAGWSS